MLTVSPSGDWKSSGYGQNQSNIQAVANMDYRGQFELGFGQSLVKDFIIKSHMSSLNLNFCAYSFCLFDVFLYVVDFCKISLRRRAIRRIIFSLWSSTFGTASF